MTSMRGTGAFLVAALLAAVPAAAQAPLELTLEDAVARGLAAAPRMTEARARETAAEAGVASRTAAARPVVTASSSYLRTNHVDEFGIPQANGTTRIIFPDLPDNYEARTEMTVPLYTGGRTAALVSAAEADRRAAEADRHATEADVALDVRTAYWTLVTARERVAVLQRALERADVTLESVRARVESGVLPPNDVLSSQAQRARQNVQLITARNDAALAESELGRLVGAPPGQPLTLTTPADRPTPGLTALLQSPAADLTKRAIEARPEVQALGAREASLRLGADAVWAATRPQIGVLAGLEPARPNPRFVPRADTWNTSWDLGVNVKWTLWDGGRARADRTAGEAQADAVHARADEFTSRLGVEVRQRLLDVSAAGSALTASSEAVSAAAEARRVVGERFDVGVATNTDVLDADVAWLEAELEHTRLLAGLRISEARLVRSLGAP